MTAYCLFFGVCLVYLTWWALGCFDLSPHSSHRARVNGLPWRGSFHWTLNFPLNFNVVMTCHGTMVTASRKGLVTHLKEIQTLIKSHQWDVDDDELITATPLPPRINRKTRFELVNKRINKKTVIQMNISQINNAHIVCPNGTCWRLTCLQGGHGPKWQLWGIRFSWWHSGGASHFALHFGGLVLFSMPHGTRYLIILACT